MKSELRHARGKSGRTKSAVGFLVSLTCALILHPGATADEVCTSSSYCVYQVGAVAPFLSPNRGFKTTNTIRLPLNFVGGEGAAFWIGGNTKAGEFVQAGWALEGPKVNCGDDIPFFFISYLDSSRTSGETYYGTCGAPGGDGTSNTFEIYRYESSTLPRSNLWGVSINGTLTRNLYLTGSFAKKPYAVAELSKFGSHPSWQHDQLGPVRFSPAILASMERKETTCEDVAAGSPSASSTQGDIFCVPPKVPKVHSYWEWKTGTSAFYAMPACQGYDFGVTVHGTNDMSAGDGQPCQPQEIDCGMANLGIEKEIPEDSVGSIAHHKQWMWEAELFQKRQERFSVSPARRHLHVSPD